MHSYNNYYARLANSDFVCLETLAATCQSDSSDSTLKSKTIRRLLNRDIDVNSEDCQDQCMEALLRDRTPRKRAKPHAQCRCFCLYHQICLQQEVSGKFPISNFYTYLIYPCQLTVSSEQPTAPIPDTEPCT